MGVPVSLSEALGPSVNDSRGSVILIGLNAVDDSPEEYFVLQYYPESFTDTKAVNWQQKEIAGGSLPLYQCSVNQSQR